MASNPEPARYRTFLATTKLVSAFAALTGPSLRIWFSIGLFALILLTAYALEEATYLRFGKYIFCMLLVAVVIPSRHWKRYLPAAATFVLLIEIANRIKINLIYTPITPDDIRIVLRNPSGLLSAIGMDQGAQTAAYLFSSAVLITLTFLLSRAFLSSVAHYSLSKSELRRLSVSCVVGAAFTIAAFITFEGMIKRFVSAAASGGVQQDSWTPEFMAYISRHIGVIPFLVIVSEFEKTAGIPIDVLKEGPHNASSPPPNSKNSIYKFVHGVNSRNMLPNIVVLLLESTFEIDKTFKIRPELKTSLSSSFPDATLQGALTVNVVGGGTWVSEFEAITGIPSRLYGYRGYYTHVSLAPYVRSTFATYLASRGYQTIGLYATDGDFYQARMAYKSYGFSAFFDSVELGLQDGWRETDLRAVSAYARKLAELQRSDNTKEPNPLFAFGITIENHSPHPCLHFKESGPLPYEFIGPANFRKNCELNEYIRRQSSTQMAVEAMEDFLKKRETETGRPYVLLIFGDHQPHTFASTGSIPLIKFENYDDLRLTPNNYTFYQVRSSMVSPFYLRKMDVPIVLLPTLLSAFVASNEADLYLASNFDLFEKCGSEIKLPKSTSLFGRLNQTETGSPMDSELTSDCVTALRESTTSYTRAISLP